jgi:hypothetical protein
MQNCPAGQLSQSASVSFLTIPVEPFGHRQSMYVELFGLLIVGSGHGVLELPAQKKLIGHVSHSVSDVALHDAVEYIPSIHVEQVAQVLES